MTQRETVLFQIIEVALTLYGAFFVGQKSARAAASEVVRPHVRSAFRRLLSLYQALGRLQSSIDDRRSFLDGNSKKGMVDLVHVGQQLDILAVQVVADLATADDAMEDWRDLVPDEVAKIEEAAGVRHPVRDIPGLSRVYWSASPEHSAGLIPSQLLDDVPPIAGAPPGANAEEVSG